jgi:hypothetical protein
LLERVRVRQGEGEILPEVATLELALGEIPAPRFREDKFRGNDRKRRPQNDKRRRAQNDRAKVSLGMTKNEGMTVTNAK